MSDGANCIGIDNARIEHMLGVARRAQRIATDALGWDDEKGREMFVLGLLHDVGYEFSHVQSEHPDIGGALLREAGYKYWREVFWHGKPSPEYMSDELMVLNLADLEVSRSGEPVSIAERLADIRERYGPDSKQFEDAGKLAEEVQRFFGKSESTTRRDSAHL